MADSFELLRARITIDVSNVKAAALEVAKLQGALNKLSKPIKLNIGDTTRATRAGGAPAEQIAKATEAANRAAVKSTQQALKEDERLRREHVNVIIRLAQRAQIRARDPNIDQATRLRLLQRAEERLLRARALVSQRSQQAVAIERNLINIRRAAEPGIDRLAAKLRSLANITDAASRAPGVSNFVGNIARLGSGLLRAVANITKLGASAIALTLGIATLVVSLGIGVSLMIKFAAASLRAAVAIGRAGLSLAFQALTAALRVVLTPIRAVYAELSRLFSIAGMRAFVNDTLDLASRMETIRKQLELGFGGDAEAEFQRLRQEADLFGTSLLDLSQSFAKFALVAKSAGVDIATIRRLFTGIQAAGRVFGISADDLQGIFRALEQISSKGKLTSEELIRQLGDRLPGAFALAARSLNRSTAQLVEDLKAGTVSAQQFFEAFGTQTLLEFYDKAIALSDTLNARLQRLRNIADLVRIAFGNIFSDTLVFAVERIAQAAIRMREAFRPIGAVFARITTAFRKAVASMNFEALFNSLATLLNSMAPIIEQFLDRLGRIGIVFNGAVLVAALGAIKAAITALNTGMGLFLAKLQQLTGIDLSTAERAFAAVAAALEVLPSLMINVADMARIVGNAFKNLFNAVTAAVQAVLFQFKVFATLMKPILLPAILAMEQSLAALKSAVNQAFQGATEGLTLELQDMLAQIAAAQKKLQQVMEGEDGKGKNPAADQINGAADNLRDAMTTKTGDILGIEEAVRRLNAAGAAAVAVDAPQVEQKQQEDIAATAFNTSRMVALLEAQGRLTPFAGRGPGFI